jgi:Flp pilus assembly protein CpaB
MSALARQLRALRRAASWHRRLLAAGLAAGAVAAGLHALTPPAAAGAAVLVAARDLTGGAPLRPGDVRIAQLPMTLVPASAVPVGADLGDAVLAAPLGAGETLTTTRLVGPSLLRGYGEAMVGVPVRLADAAVAPLLHAGDLVDILAADASGIEPAAMPAALPATVVAPAVRVVAVLAEDDAAAFGNDGGSGALIVIAAGPEIAAAVAGAEATSRLSVVLRPAGDRRD